MQQVVQSHLERRKLLLKHGRPTDRSIGQDHVNFGYMVHSQTELAMSCDSTIYILKKLKIQTTLQVSISKHITS